MRAMAGESRVWAREEERQWQRGEEKRHIMPIPPDPRPLHLLTSSPDDVLCVLRVFCLVLVVVWLKRKDGRLNKGEHRLNKGEHRCA